MNFKDIQTEIDKLLSTEKGKEYFAQSMSMYCYNMLDEDEKEIYDKSTQLFSYEDCVGHVLSVLTMRYLDIPNITKEKMIELHSTLYTPFIMVESLHWVMDELIKLKDKREKGRCL